MISVGILIYSVISQIFLKVPGSLFLCTRALIMYTEVSLLFSPLYEKHEI